MPICGIYSIKELSTGKIYIGQSVDIKEDGQSTGRQSLLPFMSIG